MQQIRALERGADVVVATPGRALDHIRRGTLKLDAARRPRPRRSRRDARHGLRRGSRRDPRGDAGDAPDGALLGDDAGAHPVDCRAAPEEPDARDHRAREAAAGKLPRVRQVAYIVAARAQAGGARARARHGESRRRRSSSAARASKSTRSPRRSTRTATAPRRCTAAWNSASATA